MSSDRTFTCTPRIVLHFGTTTKRPTDEPRDKYWIHLFKPRVYHSLMGHSKVVVCSQKVAPLVPFCAEHTSKHDEWTVQVDDSSLVRRRRHSIDCRLWSQAIKWCFAAIRFSSDGNRWRQKKTNSTSVQCSTKRERDDIILQYIVRIRVGYLRITILLPPFSFLLYLQPSVHIDSFFFLLVKTKKCGGRQCRKRSYLSFWWWKLAKQMILWFNGSAQLISLAFAFLFSNNGLNWKRWLSQ